METEDYELMDEPCMCVSCGAWFDLKEGNPCFQCKQIFCDQCLEEPFDTCERCADND